MRISGWSSDVCSSDLGADLAAQFLRLIVGPPVGIGITTPRGLRPQHENVDTLIGGPAMAKWNAGAVRPWRRPRPCPRLQQGKHIVGAVLLTRTEERREGKECVSTSGSWWAADQ